MKLLYEAGLSIPLLTPLTNRKEGTVYFAFKKHGITYRKRQGRKGAAHHNWKDGQPMHFDNGRQRARAWFKLEGACQICNIKPAVDRHHKDGNSFNNVASNIQLLCRRCHQKTDGRLAKLQEIRKKYVERVKGKPNPKGQSARGHEYAQLYNQGMSSGQIAKQFGVNPNSVLSCLKTRGIKIRARGKNTA